MSSGQILAYLCNLIAPVLGQKCVKGLRVTKIVKEIKSEMVWGKLEAKKMLPETTIHKIFETNSSFYLK